jgi:hypothetical protein
MSDKLHLIAPLAATAPAGLKALLAAMAPAARIECGEDSPSTPFELALAQANGLPGEPGHIPWAAFETGTTGTPCAWVKLCHWQVGADNVTLSPPQELAIDAQTSSALLAAMQPYFAEDGIALQPYGALAGIWFATGEPLRELRTVSLDQLAGKRLTPAMLDAAGSLRRLQNEMQMLLYTHPANDERQRQGLPPVNSFWITGAGALDQPVPPAPHVRVEASLSEDSCAQLLALLRAGGDARLTLCGARAAQAFEAAPDGLWHRFKGVLGLQPAWDGRDQL